MPIEEGNQHLHRHLFAAGAQIAPRALIEASDVSWEALVARLSRAR